MSGHSKWSTIKRKKGAADAKRGQVFTRLAREVSLAAREGGGDITMNFKLRLAVDRARAQNMPKDSIDRAIKRGTGEGKDGMIIEEITYEGYGPNGVALIIDCLTENRNRTVADLRHVLSKSGGSLGETGSVAWQFTRNSYFSFSSKGLDFDQVFELAVEAGADDITEEDGTIEVIAPAESFKIVNDALNNAKINLEDAGLRYMPNQELELGVEDTLKAMRVIENLEEMDDIRSVSSNLSISEEALAALEAG